MRAQGMRTPLEQRIGKKATEWAIEHLQLMDYILIPPEAPGDFQWETIQQLADRLGMHHDTICRRLNWQECPAYERKEGETGRLRVLRSNFSLDAFLKQKSRYGGRPFGPQLLNKPT